MEEGSPEHKIFNYLGKNVSQDKDEYNSVKQNCGIKPEGKIFEEAMIELTALGLIEIEFIPLGNSYINKRHEFYHAQRLGLPLWYEQHLINEEREKRKIIHDARVSKMKAWFWWVSLLALAVSVVSLYFSINK